MENLQYGEIPGEDRINSGFYWGSETGIYCVNLWSPGGGAEPFRYQNLYAYPAGGYFSMKKSNQKSFRAAP